MAYLLYRTEIYGIMLVLVIVIMKNKTLTKNMPNVKWHAIPPVKGPDSQGVKYGSNKKNPSFNKKPLGKNK